MSDKKNKGSVFSKIKRMFGSSNSTAAKAEEKDAEKLYLLTEAQKKTAKKNSIIQIVAEENNMTLGETMLKMDEFRNQYGISYRKFAKKNMMRIKTDEKLERVLNRIKKEKERYVKNVAKETGWSEEKALAEVTRAADAFGFDPRSYYKNQIYLMSDKEIAAYKVSQKAKKEAKIKKVMKETGWSRGQVLKHMNMCDIVYNIDNDYYMIFKAWELTREQLDSYATLKTGRRMTIRYNKNTKFVEDKSLFAETFGKYSNRKFWVNRDTTFEEFKEFTEGIDEMFCKPLDLSSGKGARKLKVEEDLQAQYDELISQDSFIAEEVVVQHHEMAEFYPGSVNTVRIVTLLKDDEVHTLCSFVRFGRNGVTDNFSTGGVTAAVDVETGIIMTPAIDKSGDVYETHPVSGKKIVGFQIPNWPMVREITERAIRVVDGLNYVGWDVAVCEDKVCLIEGNSAPGLGTYQATFAPVKEGQKHLFEKYL